MAMGAAPIDVAAGIVLYHAAFGLPGLRPPRGSGVRRRDVPRIRADTAERGTYRRSMCKARSTSASGCSRYVGNSPRARA